ncbi:NAD(P)-binding protein [Wilcoxina mikolae CBS 423.85]|nr:NAD(P)-binding protein [Wilcoxina mikolae CBS 423.85]
MQLLNISDCQNFVSTQSASDIAARLRIDQEICRAGGSANPPSLLVYCLPPSHSPAADAISRALNADPSIPVAVGRMRYAGIVKDIKRHLGNMAPEWPPVPLHLTPDDSEFNAALKVLQYVQLPPNNLDQDTPLNSVEAAVQAQLSLGPGVRTALRSIPAVVPPDSDLKPGQKNARHKKRTKRCYICQYTLRSAHTLYPSLCNPCGNFNIAESSLSLPQNLNLDGKTALVTGGRTNLGYHTALRLLRCGARVVVSSRYPFDTKSRYLQEGDSADWLERLKIVGADFRTAADVFALVNAVRRCLGEWGTEKLDMLINNAAQTWTDAVETEMLCVRREEQLCSSISNAETTLILPPGESTWTQKMHKIPYEDVITSYGINAFVPFVLIRELLPLMCSSTRSNKPTGYIINVSAREGQPEHIPTHKRAGYHVHTNMAKAALNMLTETEAAVVWREERIAMNSVDPGYLSSDPQWMEMWGREGEVCPIGWEDGAGRVLWAIAKGEIEGVGVWGRFLKHFIVLHTRRDVSNAFLSNLEISRDLVELGFYSGFLFGANRTTGSPPIYQALNTSFFIKTKS